MTFAIDITDEAFKAAKDNPYAFWQGVLFELSEIKDEIAAELNRRVNENPDR